MSCGSCEARVLYKEKGIDIMRILIDAMGGDNAPNAIVQGAVDAAKEFDVKIVLVGRGEAILKSLSELGMENLPKGV